MNIKQTCSTCAIAFAFMFTCSHAALADGNAFTPLNFDDTSYTAPGTSSYTTVPKAKAVVNTAPAAENLVGNGGIQNAILQLDNAQVDIRNDLLNYKAKFSDVDAQYKLIKNERKMLDKQVKSTEKRIKNIDKAKEKIRKNML